MTKVQLCQSSELFDEYLGTCCEFTPDEPPNIECWRRWVMRILELACQPGEITGESTTRQVNDWITEQARPEYPDYQYAEFAMWWQCSGISGMGVEMPELKIRHIVKRKRDRAIRRVFLRNKSSGSVGIINQIR